MDGLDSDMEPDGALPPVESEREQIVAGAACSSCTSQNAAPGRTEDDEGNRSGGGADIHGAFPFPPPPATKTFCADALRLYRVTKAAFDSNQLLKDTLFKLRGTDQRPPKVYSSARGAELQLHVVDLAEALAALALDKAGAGWNVWAVGKTEHARLQARRVSLTPTAETLAAHRTKLESEPAAEKTASSPDSAGINSGPKPVEKDTALTRLAARIAKGASLEDPDTFKTCPDYQTNTHIEDIYKRWDSIVTPDEIVIYEPLIRQLVAANVRTAKELNREIQEWRKESHVTPKKSKMLHVYNMLKAEGAFSRDTADLAHVLVKKSSKSESGVLVITVLTSPYPSYTDSATGERVRQTFSCEWNCYYCPNEPDQPRSYLHDEPSVLRANQNNFDPVLQFTDRAATLAINGHPVDKIELLVLGGTWSSYPHEYQEEFIRDLFYAANTFHERTKRPRHSLRDEQLANESAVAKIIGLTLETRPDTIDARGEEITRLRRYGCTRVQLGIQHSDDRILRKINRGCTTRHAIDAIRRLKNAGYKVDVHLMPNLPGSTPACDKEMFRRMLEDPDLQADQWKIYPCEVVPWTVIKKWYDSGKYVPYDDVELFELLISVKSRVHPWIRLNRVVRDIPSQYILGGMNAPNLRQGLLEVMAQRGLACRCIRCREVGDNVAANRRAVLTERSYSSSLSPSSDGAGNEINEHFLSFETPDQKTICAFLRLRLPPKGSNGSHAIDPEAVVNNMDENTEKHVSEQAEVSAEQLFPELQGCALVRELHVYGQLVAAVIPGNDTAAAGGLTPIAGSDGPSQHMGFGRQLMARAEEIAAENGYDKLAVISGIGARAYYRKLGYTLPDKKGYCHGEYMIKPIDQNRIIAANVIKDALMRGPRAAVSWSQQWDAMIDRAEPTIIWGAVVAILGILFILGTQFAVLYSTDQFLEIRETPHQEL